MSHYFESGFTVRQPAWHGLGIVLDEYPGSWDEARKIAELDWEPVLEPVYTRELVVGDDGTPEETYQETRFRLNRRSDNGHVLAAGFSEGYGNFGIGKMGEVVEAVLAEAGQAIKYETAGSVELGAKVYATAYLNDPWSPSHDPSFVLPYVVFLNSFDGSSAVKILRTDVRVVCANTFGFADAHGDQHGYQFSFRHTNTVEDRVGQAKKALAGIRDDVAEWRAWAERLALIPVTKQLRERFVVEFIPAPPESLVSDRVARNVEEARGAVRSILAGPTCAPIADTAWGLVQSAGEYLDHYRRSRSAETYVKRTLLRAEPLKAKAVQLVESLVG